MAAEESLKAVVGRLTLSVEALGALGAILRLRVSGTSADPEVERALADVVGELGLSEALSRASPAELSAALSPIRAVLLQSLDLVSDPLRAPGWSYTDAELLESQGQTSAEFAEVFKRAVVPELPGLASRLDAPHGAFLDIGAGVAGLTVAMCRLWPALRAVGIDPWDPALALGRRNVSAAGLTERIELRHARVEELDEVDAYDLVWLPGPFLSLAALDAAIGRVVRSLHPGGWAVLALYRGAGDLASALARLRTVRSGGSLLTSEEGALLLAAAGLVDVRSFTAEIGIPGHLVAGRRAS